MNGYQENSEADARNPQGDYLESRCTRSGGPVTVELYGHLATLAGKSKYTTWPGTASEILENLFLGIPEAVARQLMDPGRQVFNIYLVLGDENLHLPDGLERQLRGGDTLKIISSVAGG
ncbi:MAG: MoaD/ThiS family protein [Bacillota bacterium]